MARHQVRIERVTQGAEEAVLAKALDQVAVGDLVVYYRGLSGFGPTALKRAALKLHDAGLCLLTQRITGDKNADGDRIVDYLAIKTKGRAG